MRAFMLLAASAALLGGLWAAPAAAQAPSQGPDIPPPAMPPPGFPPPGFPPLGGPGWIPPGGSAAAQDRYELQQVEGGFLRLDRVSGLTAFCASTPDGYACKPVAEGKSAQDAMLARLESRVAELEKQVKALSSGKTAAAAPPRDPTLDLPSDDQVDRVASFLERALKRFKRLSEDVQKDMGQSDDGKL